MYIYLFFSKRNFQIFANNLIVKDKCFHSGLLNSKKIFKKGAEPEILVKNYLLVKH